MKFGILYLCSILLSRIVLHYGTDGWGESYLLNTAIMTFFAACYLIAKSPVVWIASLAWISISLVGTGVMLFYSKYKISDLSTYSVVSSLILLVALVFLLIASPKRLSKNLPNLG